jgi:hypothetical protein
VLKGVVDSEHIAADKGFPGVLVVVVIGPEDEVDDVDEGSFHYQPANSVSDEHLGVFG